MSEYLAPGHAPLKFHPLANLFPMLDEASRASFRASLSERQNNPIWLHRGMVLDGRNRYRELADLNKGVSYRVFSGTDREAFDLVMAENLERRHLTESQRAMVAAKAATLKLGANQHSGKTSGRSLLLFSNELSNELAEISAPSDEPLISQSEAAKSFSVSADSIQFANAVHEKGATELRDAVTSGDIAVSTAAKIAKNRPIDEQKALLESLPRDDAGKLTPDAKREIRKAAKEVRAEDQAEKKRKRDEKEQKLGAKIRSLPDIKAGLILSDFEWHFKVRSEETGMDRHAANHYVTAKEASTPEAIVERQRERMSVAAEDCIHLMWCPASFNAVALKVMELQGFTYVSQFAWIKPGIGTGFWVRDRHELLLIGVKGKIPCPAMGDQFDSAIEAPKGAHSEKPDFQYEIAEHYFPSLPKIELNARRPREGWIQWGNQAPEPEQGALGIETAEAAE